MAAVFAFFLPAQYGPNPEDNRLTSVYPVWRPLSKSTYHPDSWAAFAGDGQIEKGRSAAPVPVPLIAKVLARTSTSPRTATSWNKSIVWLFISYRCSITTLRERSMAERVKQPPYKVGNCLCRCHIGNSELDSTTFHRPAHPTRFIGVSLLS